MRAACVLLAMVLASGCGQRRANNASDPVRQYLRLAVALGERDPDSLDYYYGPAEWVADVRADPPALSVIKQSALGMIDRLQFEAPERQPAAFLIPQLRAIAARAAFLSGVKSRFDHEAEALFGVRRQPDIDERKLEQVRKEIARSLPGEGSLAVRYAQFDQEFLVPPETLSAVMNRAVAECRARTAAHLSLPPGETVDIEYVSNKPWSAYSRYLGNYRSTIQVNADLPVTVDRALELACHEGYPGHHVINVLSDELLVKGRGRSELMAQPTFSPQSFTSESAATIAAALAFPDGERIAFERDVLFPLAGLSKSSVQRYLQVQRLIEQLEIAEVPIARSYLDGDLEFLRAGAAFEKDVLMAHPEATLKYLNEYRTYMLTYTWGRSVVRDRVLSGAGTAESWRNYAAWITSESPSGLTEGSGLLTSRDRSSTRDSGRIPLLPVASN